MSDIYYENGEVYDTETGNKVSKQELRESAQSDDEDD